MFTGAVAVDYAQLESFRASDSSLQSSGPLLFGFEGAP